ncbi:MAG: alkaline phosphatase family protein [Deltaproteobacteria bacterium]|nr:alkaline phosphatase family protein [Deltaproteobacteria bacterium]
MPRTTSASLRTLWIVPLLLGLAVGCHWFRRATIRSFFKDGVPGPGPALHQPPAGEPGLAPVRRVRVVLIDGLGLAFAPPTLQHVCAQGLDLVVDSGFPTVSLPVQHVLWTGRTQGQSGVLYRIAALPSPPVDALPLAVPDAVAVAESHNEIVRSFGFAKVQAPVGIKAVSEADERWRNVGFAAAARTAIQSEARLAFVHVLRVDEAGHAEGPASDRYAMAVRSADELLHELVSADPERETTRWLILSDHGHRRDGGHADAEGSIRLVRACLFGAGLTHSRAARPIHLVDVHRALADSLGVATTSMGRPLPFALTQPDRNATLPSPRWPAWVWALAMLAGAAWATWRCARDVLFAYPFWFPVAYAVVWLSRGAITLSNPIVYPPLGLTGLTAFWPALVLLCVQAWFALSRLPVVRVAFALLSLPAAALAAVAVLCNALPVWLGVADPPPLVPWWSAHTAVFASVTSAACVALSVGVIAHAVWPTLRRRLGAR